MRTLTTTLTLGAVLLSGAAHAAEADWFASLYTGEGIELRADERVFALFSVLNALGYDQAPVVREHPIAKHQFHPVREQVRARVSSGGAEVAKQADAFFDAHPSPLNRYLAYTLQTSPPPFSSGAKGKEVADLKGWEGVLAKAHSTWKLDELLGQAQGEYRKGLKAYLAGLDKPMLQARKLLKVDDGTASVLVLNLLDGRGEVRGAWVGQEVVVVAGPSEPANIDGVVREFARAVLEPKVGRKAAGWSGGQALLREAQVLGAQEQTVGEYATALLARAVAVKATGGADAAYEAEAKRGYFGLKDIGRYFDDGKPVDGWMMEALAKAETRRPAARK